MNKKLVLLLSSLLTTVVLTGTCFAAFAVTDQADPFGINVTPGELEEDTETQYTTLSWGQSTALNNVANVVPGHIYKVGIVSLKSTLNYRGVLSLELTDESTGKELSDPKFINYIQFYIYEGAKNDTPEDTLPELDLLCSSSLGDLSLAYNNALGTSAGKEYSVFMSYDGSAIPVASQVQNDVVSISVDWNAASGDIADNQKTVYFASNWHYSDCYLYAWKDNGSNGTWPGVKLSYIGKNQYDQDIYEGILTDGYEYMIFSNGGTESGDKTKDLTISTYDFTQGDLLFYRNDDGSAGTVVFNNDMLVYDYNMGQNPGPILQAFGWTTEKVRTSLSDIKAAGYNAVQISPLQPLGSGSSSQNWSLVYQPLGFSIANSNENPLGDRNSLIKLTNAANDAGIDIIVDVVTNHLAQEPNQYGKLNTMVRNYEQKIYDEWMVHDNGGTSDSSVEAVVRGSLGGLPDLKTENEHIQNRVISMLNDYIDCGIKGFRFDAAKHIETPDDGYYASNFWKNVIGAINRHGVETYNKAPYSCGEILGTGAGRSWDAYTRYIDVTDYGVTYNTRSSAESYSFSLDGIKNGCGYTVGSGYNAVIFAESHDNFIHGDTTLMGSAFVNMLYGLHASREACSALFFARPVSAERYQYVDNTDGKTKNNPNIVVYNVDDDYKSAFISSVNKLHNDFVGGSENLYTWNENNCLLNVRTLNGKHGVYICNPTFDYDGSASKTLQIYDNNGLVKNCSFKNLINNQVINIGNDGYFTITLSSGVAVLEQI